MEGSRRDGADHRKVQTNSIRICFDFPIGLQSDLIVLILFYLIWILQAICYCGGSVSELFIDSGGRYLLIWFFLLNLQIWSHFLADTLDVVQDIDWVISLGNAFAKQYELYTYDDEHSALLHSFLNACLFWCWIKWSSGLVCANGKEPTQCPRISVTFHLYFLCIQGLVQCFSCVCSKGDQLIKSNLLNNNILLKQVSNQD
ncbi:unnamed protein product [Lactuca saligna]|uniref:Uncharacterized protein n=1 Tax=Lactuca saligna TaxID=75948 RepID=A0AA35VLV2_LACSI|nr:unnamed protein product [Lactuca saligna]